MDGAQDEQAPQQVSQEGLPDLAPLMADVEAIRSLAFRQPVPAERQSPEDFADYIQQDLNTYFPPDKRQAMMAGLHRLGMITEPVDIAQEMAEAVMSQAAAYYDPESRTFYYVMGGMPEAMLKTVATHELVHALQDQHHDLRSRIEQLENELEAEVRNDDALLAFRFLVEGEATYVQTIWDARQQMGMDLLQNKEAERGVIGMMSNLSIDQLIAQAEMLTQGLEEDNPMVQAMRDMETIPPYVLHPLYAAYMKGAFFCMSVRHHGGWEALSAVYDDEPQTTEQVLHPEKYFGEQPDQPTPIELAEAPLLELSNMEPIDAAVHGEMYLRILLTNHGLRAADAADAAAGWDGDIYQAWRDRDSGRVMIVFASTWDSDADAEEFALAYREIVENKYEGFQEIRRDATSLLYHCSDNPLDSGQVLQHGREVFIVEGAPRSLIDMVIEDLRAMRVRHVD